MLKLGLFVEYSMIYVKRALFVCWHKSFCQKGAITKGQYADGMSGAYCPLQSVNIWVRGLFSSRSMEGTLGQPRDISQLTYM